MFPLQNAAKSDDFEHIRTLGTGTCIKSWNFFFIVFPSGSFGRVVLVKHSSTESFFAMKILPKKKVISQQRGSFSFPPRTASLLQIVLLNQIEHAINEKRILQALSFPFLVHLEYYFQVNTVQRIFSSSNDWFIRTILLYTWWWSLYLAVNYLVFYGNQIGSGISLTWRSSIENFHWLL